MITKTKSIHYCEFKPCKKKNYSKKVMEKHEAICFFNPANKVACNGCKHLEPTKIDLDFKDDSRQVNGFYCTKKQICVYPKKAERLVLKYPETFEEQIPMPKECEFFKSNDLLFANTDFDF